ncbi:MAG: signal peptidase I [Clostridia bacterium]|nr:signal peptidase I [Clostridia bacterium]
MDTETKTEKPLSKRKQKQLAKKEKLKSMPLGKRVLYEIKDWLVSIVVALIAVYLIKTFIFMPITVDGSSMNPTLLTKEKLFVTAYDVNIWNGLKRGDAVICHYYERTNKDPILKLITLKTNFVKRIVGVPGDTVSRVSGVTYVNGTALDPANKISSSNTYTLNDDGSVSYYRNGALLDPENASVLASLRITATEDASGNVTYRYYNPVTHSTQTATDINTALSHCLCYDYEYVLGEKEYFVVGDNRYNSHDCRAWAGPGLPKVYENDASGDVGPITKNMIVGHVRAVFIPKNGNKVRSVPCDPDYMYPTDR